MGLLLLGPHITYPEHAHPAAEIYAVVAGRAEWLQGDRIWRNRAPGELIRHASMEPHAMRTGGRAVARRVPLAGSSGGRRAVGRARRDSMNERGMPR